MFTHRFYIRLTGAVWFVMGAWLLYKGLNYVSIGSQDASGVSSLFDRSERGASMLISIGFVVGYLKGRMVLRKSAERVARRILSLPLPLSITKIYAPSYWILIGSMMLLGMLLNVVPIPLDLRGAIDVAIGSALFSGALFYFKLKIA